MNAHDLHHKYDLNEHIIKILRHLRIKSNSIHYHDNIIALIYTYLTISKYDKEQLDYIDFHISNCMTLLMYCFCELLYKKALNAEY